jgi:signal transduction histidine kinase
MTSPSSREHVHDDGEAWAEGVSPAQSPSVEGISDSEMTELVERADGVVPAQERLRRLQEANRTIVGELDLPLVLRKIVEAARELVRARYAALGVIGSDGLLEQFIHSGMSQSDVESVGELPKGRGLLGALIADPRPIRVPDLRRDHRSAGFPEGHPSMTGFLGVPIRSRNEIFGNLYLTDRQGGDFSAEDEDLLMSLAATAGIAIENARLYEESGRRQAWLQASVEIVDLLLTGWDGPADEPQQRIVRAVRELADADVATLVIPADAPGMLEVAVASGLGESQLTGLQYDTTNTLVALAMRTGRGVRLSDAHQQLEHPVHLATIVDVGPVMAVPLSGRAGPQGALTVGRLAGRRSFSSVDLEMAEACGGRAAVARELVDARADHQRLAILEDRDRIARDLHDHVIQRLFADGLTLQSVAMMTRDPQLAQKVSRVVDDIDDTIRQIRTSIFQLRSGDAQQRAGLRSAVLAVTAQVTPMLGFEPAVRFSGPADTLVPPAVVGDVEAVVREATTNAAKHAHASEVTVDLSVTADTLRVEVGDDGVGLGTPQRSSGLDNLRRRAQELGGTLTIQARPTGGTQLLWTIPISR